MKTIDYTEKKLVLLDLVKAARKISRGRIFKQSSNKCVPVNVNKMLTIV